jgi:excisionase family DNA binding protein
MLLTAKEVAAEWQIPLSRVYELTRRGLIPHLKLGARQLRFDPESLREWKARGGNIEDENKSTQLTCLEK